MACPIAQAGTKKGNRQHKLECIIGRATSLYRNILETFGEGVELMELMTTLTYRDSHHTSKLNFSTEDKNLNTTSGVRGEGVNEDEKIILRMVAETHHCESRISIQRTSSSLCIREMGSRL